MLSFSVTEKLYSSLINLRQIGFEYFLFIIHLQTNFFKMKIRKLLRVLHRDFGYFIVGMTIVYSLSGIFLNHRYDFNPDYKIFFSEFQTEFKNKTNLTQSEVEGILQNLDHKAIYKKQTKLREVSSILISSKLKESESFKQLSYKNSTYSVDFEFLSAATKESFISKFKAKKIKTTSKNDINMELKL